MFTVREASVAWPCCAHRDEHGGEGADPGTPLRAMGSDEEAFGSSAWSAPIPQRLQCSNSTRGHEEVGLEAGT